MHCSRGSSDERVTEKIGRIDVRAADRGPSAVLDQLVSLKPGN